MSAPGARHVPECGVPTMAQRRPGPRCRRDGRRRATVEALDAAPYRRRFRFQLRQAPGAADRPPRPEKSRRYLRSGSTEFKPGATSRRRSPSSSTASARPGRYQAPAGVTGSGKTFTMAKVIEATQRPALVLAPNKMLAAQLYGEFQELLPRQRGRVLRVLLRLLPAGGLRAASDTYHREGISINEQIDRMRHPRPARCWSATTSSSWPRSRASTASARSRPTRRCRSGEARRAHRAAPAHRRPLALSTSASRTTSPRHLPGARRRHRAFPAHLEDRPGASACSATRSNRSPSSTRSPARRSTTWSW